MARKKYKEVTKYSVMWILVMFDLPVSSKKAMRWATRFRNELLELGFIMKQFSVYMRHCESMEKAERISNKISPLVPDNGKVSIYFLTDRQYGMAKNFFGKATEENEEHIRRKTEQLLLF